jgi:hypothetical protein
MSDWSPARWVFVIVVALAIVALIAWARHDAGIDDRVPDPEDAVAVAEPVLSSM